MNTRYIRFFVLFFALLMPFQAFAMMANCTLMNKAEHCKQMQQTAQKQPSAALEHCQMHEKTNPQQKQAPQKADCCLGNACAAICGGLVFPASLSIYTFNVSNDFRIFISPQFNSQLPDSLERPPRAFS